MAKTQSTEYIIGTKDGDNRWFESRSEARDFIEENRENVNAMIEKRVWDHSECGSRHAFCEVDEKKTEIISAKDFMKPREV